MERLNSNDDSTFPRQEYDHRSAINNAVAYFDETEPAKAPQTQQQYSNYGSVKTQNINELLSNINRKLLIPKAFYLFFFSAFGSLFPLMAVYFKQMGLNAIQTGVLIGIRPFIEFMAAPFWSSLADRFRKCKVMLLMSLFCWIVFTLSLAYIRPPASACVIFNETHHILYTPYSKFDQNEDDTAPEVSDYGSDDDLKWSPEQQQHHKHPPNYVIGKSPSSVEYTLNYQQYKHVQYVSPPYSSVVYKTEDVKEVFFLLLLLIILGEFFSAPAITLADCATLTYLGENADEYGKQRMFGSVGWGITMFLVGIALDNSTKFSDHPCGPHPGERNYRTCFTIFSILMGCSFLVSTQFIFEYDEIDPNAPIGPNEIQLKPYNGPGPRPIFNTAPPINKPPELRRERKFEFIDKWKSAVFAQRTRELPEWVTVIKAFANVRYGIFLFVTWFLGFGIGLVFTFLFWHLQDLGGTPTLYGMASVINHISEICAYFFSIKFIKQYGHTRVLCVGLAGNVFRFLYISWLENPWMVLPFELIQGITHAACYAACCSYMNHITMDMPELRSSTQGVLQGLHNGLGRGCGAIIGGIFVNSWGTQTTFRLYGVLSILVLVAFAHVNYYRKSEGRYGFFEEDREEVIMEDTSAMAPHGVPSNPIARSLSRHDIATDPHASLNQSTNPFVAGSNDTYYLDTSNQWNSNQTQLKRDPNFNTQTQLQEKCRNTTNNNCGHQNYRNDHCLTENVLQQPILVCDAYEW